MKITLIGTGSPIPDPNRAGPSTLVQAAGQNIVVDCGRGCVLRLTAAGVMPPFVSAILLTHLHSDHISDLNDLVTSRWIMGPVQGSPTIIIGPVGTKRVVNGLREMLALDEQYRLDHHADLRSGPGMQLDVREVSPGDTFSIGDVRVIVGKTDHRPVAPTVGYRFEAEGKVATLAGDTVPCAELDALCTNADIYVQTVLRPDLVEVMKQFVPAQAPRLHDILDYHSSVQDAGQTAARANVKTLVLTHYVPAMQPGQEGDWIAQAAEHFSGRIVVGPDLTAVEA
ncbi:MAG: MBL fold metallo-hydrolase [Ilumatobacteraceae bacterium]